MAPASPSNSAARAAFRSSLSTAGRATTHLLAAGDSKTSRAITAASQSTSEDVANRLRKRPSTPPPRPTTLLLILRTGARPARSSSVIVSAGSRRCYERSPPGPGAGHSARRFAARGGSGGTWPRRVEAIRAAGSMEFVRATVGTPSSLSAAGSGRARALRHALLRCERGRRHAHNGGVFVERLDELYPKRRPTR